MVRKLSDSQMAPYVISSGCAFNCGSANQHIIRTDSDRSVKMPFRTNSELNVVLSFSGLFLQTAISLIPTMLMPIIANRRKYLMIPSMKFTVPMLVTPKTRDT